MNNRRRRWAKLLRRSMVWLPPMNISICTSEGCALPADVKVYRGGVRKPRSMRDRQ